MAQQTVQVSVKRGGQVTGVEIMLHTHQLSQDSLGSQCHGMNEESCDLTNACHQLGCKHLFRGKNGGTHTVAKEIDRHRIMKEHTYHRGWRAVALSATGALIRTVHSPVRVRERGQQLFGRVHRATLVRVSDEPCGMCAGNTVAARAHRVVMHLPGLAQLVSWSYLDAQNLQEEPYHRRVALIFGQAQREVRERAQGQMGLPWPPLHRGGSA